LFCGVFLPTVLQNNTNFPLRVRRARYMSSGPYMPGNTTTAQASSSLPETSSTNTGKDVARRLVVIEDKLSARDHWAARTDLRLVEVEERLGKVEWQLAQNVSIPQPGGVDVGGIGDGRGIPGSAEAAAAAAAAAAEKAVHAGTWLYMHF
jgi:hypothetical protein